MLQNLVDNALRYTRAGAVSITAERAPTGIRLVVEDPGPGIDPTTLAGLFTPFRPGATPGQSGRGCGLYLVKRFAESLGGRVSVDSTLGVGTRFTIEIPAAA
jgi:signal transduction histidine kinase